MKTIAMAMGIGKCALCNLLAEQELLGHGVSSPETIRAFNLMRERNGYRGKPVYGKEWARLLRSHTEMHLGKGEPVRDDWTEMGLSAEFIKSLEPKPKRQPLARETRQEEAAMEKLRLIARPVIHQPNGRNDRRPVVRTLDSRPFAGWR